jgi:hypothetical protein
MLFMGFLIALGELLSPNPIEVITRMLNQRAAPYGPDELGLIKAAAMVLQQNVWLLSRRDQDGKVTQLFSLI